jgi:hypothetical protein
MALFVKQNEERSQLQERLAAELQEKTKKRALNESQGNDINDSEYLKNTKSTTSLAWVWLVVIVVAVTLVVVFIVISAN